MAANNGRPKSNTDFVLAFNIEDIGTTFGGDFACIIIGIFYIATLVVRLVLFNALL
jgi:cell division protein FtsW (lipid II flippase)